MGEREISALPAYRIARLGLGRTFQTPRPFLDLTAAENVARGGALERAAAAARRPSCWRWWSWAIRPAGPRAGSPAGAASCSSWRWRWRCGRA